MRLQEIKREDMSDAQGRIADAILSGPRGNLHGPFMAWLQSPELADRAQGLGEFVRFHTLFAPHLSELAILQVASHWKSDLEWAVHAKMAEKAGIDPAIIAAIKAERRPDGLDADQSVLFDFTAMLIADGRVDDVQFKRAMDRFGRQAVTELVCLIGYYIMVALTLNVFEVPVPDDG